MSPRLRFAIRAAKEAGEIVLQKFHAGVQYELKSDRTPVTEADREAEMHIRALLANEFPNESVLGEEEGGIDQPDQWTVDPIDGTRSFICGVPLFATLISYEVQGEPVLGVSHFPALGMTMYAERGSGAYCNGKLCKVSKTDAMELATICSAGIAGLQSTNRLQGMQNLVQSGCSHRTWCDAYGHALVALGRVEGMVDPRVHRWDISAMKIIVEEAGGKFTNFLGQAVLSTEAISSNQILHARIIGAFTS